MRLAVEDLQLDVRSGQVEFSTVHLGSRTLLATITAKPPSTERVAATCQYKCPYRGTDLEQVSRGSAKHRCEAGVHTCIRCVRLAPSVGLKLIEASMPSAMSPRNLGSTSLSQPCLQTY